MLWVSFKIGATCALLIFLLGMMLIYAIRAIKMVHFIVNRRKFEDPKNPFNNYIQCYTNRRISACLSIILVAYPLFFILDGPAAQILQRLSELTNPHVYLTFGVMLLIITSAMLAGMYDHLQLTKIHREELRIALANGSMLEPAILVARKFLPFANLFYRCKIASQRKACLSYPRVGYNGQQGYALVFKAKVFWISHLCVFLTEEEIQELRKYGARKSA